MLDGIAPVTLQELRCIPVNEVSKPIDVGIFPMIFVEYVDLGTTYVPTALPGEQKIESMTPLSSQLIPFQLQMSSAVGAPSLQRQDGLLHSGEHSTRPATAI